MNDDLKKMENAVEILKALMENRPDSEFLMDDKQYDLEHETLLKTTYQTFLKKSIFKVGQLVKWKPNLRNRKLPRDNQPAIVIEVLNEPIISSEQESGSPYFREPLDMILGVLDDDNTLLMFYYDSRRFESID